MYSTGNFPALAELAALKSARKAFNIPIWTTLTAMNKVCHLVESRKAKIMIEIYIITIPTYEGKLILGVK